MAKRKRLTPADPAKAPVLETKSGFPAYKDGWAGTRAPIAHVAGDAAASAALSELSEQMAGARAKGRMIVELPLDAIDPAYLMRDRIAVDEDEMQSLIASLTARGQQTPIEVVDQGDGTYGLISGWRRLQALSRMAKDGDARPALALLRSPQDTAETYLAMVEENEIRVGLSYYERARIAAVAVRQGVFASEKEALLKIYHAASRAKRSKIRSFLTLVHALDGALMFPTAIAERTGLALAKALDVDAGLGPRLHSALSATPPATAEDEAELIARTMGGKAVARPKVPTQSLSGNRNLPENVNVETRTDGSVVVSGGGFTPALRQKLLAWLKQQ